MKHYTRSATSALLFILLSSSTLWADRGEEVYHKICSHCHQLSVPMDQLYKNFFEFNNTRLKLKAPAISQISYRMKQKIGDPREDADIQRMEVSAFIADYIIYPNREKSVLNPKIEKYFQTMPSLKGKLSTEDIEAISNFVYDYDIKHKDENRIHYVSFENAIERAKKEHKIVLIEATAPHCRYCAKMTKEVLTNKKILDLLEKEFIMVSVDLSKEVLPMDLHVSMTPTFFFLFVEKNKDKVKIKRIPGAWSTEDFLNILQESILAKNQIK